jgi:hypothetical protein
VALSWVVTGQNLILFSTDLSHGRGLCIACNILRMLFRPLADVWQQNVSIWILFLFYRLTILILTTFGLCAFHQILLVRTTDFNVFKSSSYPPLSEEEIVFLRKPKWTHFKAWLKTINFVQISKKRELLRNITKLNYWLWYFIHTGIKIRWKNYERSSTTNDDSTLLI